MDIVNEHDLEFGNGEYGPKYMFKGPRFEWGIIAVEAGDTMGAHYHEEVEETFYFTEGSPQFVVDGVATRVKPGDAFRLEPGEKHKIVNDTDADARCVFIKVPFLPDDKVACD